jgi:pimeloyl-ACP methyl ester carboxylesterase
VKLLTANGLGHHVQQLGPADGPVVVCVHGLGTDSLASFYFTLGQPLAAAGFRVIMYDLRGHGRTERPPSGYRLDDFVADLAAILDELGVLAPAYLIGNSYGGTIGFGLAAQHPARVAGLAVVESEPASADWAAKMAANLSRAGTDLVRPEAMAWITARYGRHTAKLARGATALLRDTTLIADIPASTIPATDPACPVLAIYGADSDLAPQAASLAGRLARGETAIVPGQQHSVLVERAATVRDLVLPWLARCRTSELAA